MDEWLLDKAKQLAEIEDRIGRVIALMPLIHARRELEVLRQDVKDVKDMLAEAEREYREF